MIRPGLVVAALLIPAASAQVNIPQSVLEGSGQVTERLGRSVAADDATFVVGATGMQFGAVGYALVHEKVGGNWTLVKNWKPAGLQAASEFALDLDVEGDVVVAGAPKQFGGGRVYVLERLDGVWTQTQVLQSPEVDAAHRFGASVSLSGNRLLVGHEGAGHAHLFERVEHTWTAVAVLQPSVADASFGASAALDGDLAAVGAPTEDWPLEDAGVVYTFGFDGSAWIETKRIVPNTFAFHGLMGWALDLEGDLLAVASPQGNGTFQPKGNVRFYRHNAGNWNLEQTVKSPNASYFGEFGFGIDLDGSRLLVGATGWGGGSPGRACLFEDTGAGFEPVKQFRGPGGFTEDGVGESVALSGDFAVLARMETVIGGGYQVLDLTDSTWHDLGGAAKPAGDEFPRLHGFGSLQTGEPGSLELDNAWNGQLALLLVAVGAPASVPFHGGTLQVFPAVLSVPLTAGSSFQMLVPFTMLPGLTGLDFVAQYALKQPSSPLKFALSNAIVGHVP